jgi:Leucine-rich repeat (LRR) protein
MRSCRFSLDDDRGPGHEQRALAALEELLALSSARFLREIAIDVMNVPYNDIQPAVELMARRDWRMLERLALGEGIEHSTATATSVFTTDLGPVRRLLDAAPNLRTLILDSTDAEDPDFDGLALPRLRELRIFGPNGYELLQTLPRAELPELVTLDLLGSFAADPAAWDSLLSGVSLPKLRHLGFGVYSFLIRRTGALLANAPILRQLETLDLSNTPLMEPDITAILANAGAFAHLQRLAFGPLLFDNAPTAALRGLCADVRLR